MIYRVVHKTTYDYQDSVSVSHHLVRLTPRKIPGQVCRETGISISPSPDVTTTHADYFGNIGTFFTLQEPHDCLIVEARSTLELHALARPDFSASPSWETVVQSVPGDHSQEGLDAYQFVFSSERVVASREFADYARQTFPLGRPLLEAVYDLMRQINRDFRFDKKATEVTTPVEAFFQERRGVCQDFAHLQIACLRSLGLPARYVSGYLRTFPAPGRPRLVGADASHAWCSVWCPGIGWVDFDPTNDCIPEEGHITVAWGRDYSDVSPIHGVLLGGAKHTLDVGVDVTPIQ
ncbi:MAG: transglutaminase family protein [Candidatus Acidiferrales bacterium]